MTPAERVDLLRHEHTRTEYPVPCCRKDHQNWPCSTISAADSAAAAERERWQAALAEHYLMGINCDPDTKRDNPMCGCSRIHLGWHPSVGAARQAWIDHVVGLIESAPGGDPA